VFGAGDPSVTLPFTGTTLQGLDVEPSTITEFDGFTALAYQGGSARASDGRTYNLETDIRAFEGEYVADGAVRHGSFASGLFWTVDLRKTAIDFKMDGRRAVLHVRNLPLIDTFQFFGPSDAPELVDFRIE
jgi:hypothetical protein